MTEVAIPLSTHLFLLAVPAAFVVGAVLVFVLGKRRDG
jgi:hypothetical protein